MNEAATELLERLRANGFFSSYDLLGDGNLRAYDWKKMLPEMTGSLRSCWSFLLLGESLGENEVRKVLGASPLKLLQDHGLVKKQKAGLTLGKLCLIRYGGRPFFVDRSPTTKAYFGDDTKALMTMLPAEAAGACLNFNPGCGAAMLPLANGNSTELVFGGGDFDRNVIAANLVLNGWGGEPRFLKSQTPRSKSSYALIAAPCPSVFEPPGVKMPRQVAGGRDGLDRVRELLALGRAQLSKEGLLLLTFLFYSKKDVAVAKQELEAFLKPYGMDYRVVLCSKHQLEPGVPVFNMLLSTAASINPARGEAIARRMVRYVTKTQLETAYLVKATLFKSPARGEQQIVNYSDLFYGGWTF